MEKEKIVEIDTNVFEYDVQLRENITHDSYALLLKPKDKVLAITPIGFHINLTANINGIQISL